MKWITVQQVAKYLQLSTMMVYKLAQEGKLPASKIGRVWRFDQDAVDQWLREQNTSKDKPPFPRATQEIIEDFVKSLKKVFGDNISQVLVFGSQARGDASPQSDVDVLVVLKSISNYWAELDRVQKIAYSVTFDKNRLVMISPILMREDEFLTGNSPLILNIRKEAKKAA